MADNNPTLRGDVLVALAEIALKTLREELRRAEYPVDEYGAFADVAISHTAGHTRPLMPRVKLHLQLERGDVIVSQTARRQLDNGVDSLDADLVQSLTRQAFGKLRKRLDTAKPAARESRGVLDMIPTRLPARPYRPPERLYNYNKEYYKRAYVSPEIYALESPEGE